jgi:hypothetical protein
MMSLAITLECHFSGACNRMDRTAEAEFVAKSSSRIVCLYNQIFDVP